MNHPINHLLVDGVVHEVVDRVVHEVVDGVVNEMVITMIITISEPPH